MSIAEAIVKAAIPDASASLVDHILCARTIFLIGPVDAKTLYKATSRYQRAKNNGITLCEFCAAIAESDDGWLCRQCCYVVRQGVIPNDAP